jgi:hypothetical protein
MNLFFKTCIMDKNGLTNIIVYYGSSYFHTKWQFGLSLEVVVIFTPHDNSDYR